jgi:uncharacterized protein (TIGR03083 family)
VTDAAPTDTDLQPLVAAEYRALAELLAELPPERWDTPSLCSLWRVREVVAHVTMPARYDQAAFVAELQADGFDFGRLSDRIAARDAELPTEDLVGNLRSEILHAWQPPGGGAHGALNHAVVHGLDITVPLGRPRRASDDALRAVLDALTAGGGHAHFGVAIEGRALSATDLDWAFGSGVPLHGPAEDLVLHLCRRTVPDSRLRGEPLSPTPERENDAG